MPYEDIIYCDNGSCEREASERIGDGTPLCRLCIDAYDMGHDQKGVRLPLDLKTANGQPFVPPDCSHYVYIIVEAKFQKGAGYVVMRDVDTWYEDLEEAQIACLQLRDSTGRQAYGVYQLVPPR